MPEKLSPSDFLEAAKTYPVLDVRSPGEYTRARIPGAISFPIFDDAQRAAVGTCYKQKGKDQAIELGLEFVGPQLAKWVKKAKKLAVDNTVLVHCWRGGMRSGSMAWLFETAGIKVKILVGGYKAYRNEVLAIFDQPIPFRVLGGKTGSGKTAAFALPLIQLLSSQASEPRRASGRSVLALVLSPTRELVLQTARRVLAPLARSVETRDLAGLRVCAHTRLITDAAAAASAAARELVAAA